jgi:hypothetical protein
MCGRTLATTALISFATKDHDHNSSSKTPWQGGLHAKGEDVHVRATVQKTPDGRNCVLLDIPESPDFLCTDSERL